MITYEGKKGFTVAFPVVAQLLASFDLGALAGEVAALLQLTVSFTPPSVLGILGVVAAIQAAIQAGFQPPAIDIKGDLVVRYGLLKAKLELLLKIKDVLLSGSFRLYEYDGQAGAFGSELGATLGGADVDGGIAPTQQTFALLLVAEGGSTGATTLKILRSGV